MKPAFHDTDTDILAREDPREEIARVGRKNVGVSGESVSCNAALTKCNTVKLWFRIDANCLIQSRHAEIET